MAKIEIEDMFNDASGMDMGPMKEKAEKWFKVFFGWLVAFWIISTTIYQVNPQETGVVRRFGKFARTANPGLNFKFPAPLETVVLVPTREQLKEEFGFKTVKAGVRSQYNSKGFEEVRIMLTGDLNVADVQWVVQYRISDPKKYLFNVRNPTETLRDLSEVSMRKAIGDRLVDEVLTSGRDEIQMEVEESLQSFMNLYDTGIAIDLVQLQDVNPPESVKGAFNEVNESIQQKETTINQARQTYNQKVPLAKGQAAQKIAEAEGYATKRVNEAKGDAARFDQVREAWEKAQEVTETRLYLEAMEKLIEKIRKIIVIDGDLHGVLPFLNLGEEEQK